MADHASTGLASCRWCPLCFNVGPQCEVHLEAHRQPTSTLERQSRRRLLAVQRHTPNCRDRPLSGGHPATGHTGMKSCRRFTQRPAEGGSDARANRGSLSPEKISATAGLNRDRLGVHQQIL